MEYIYIGKIVNTHGIKGELRLLSNFEYKDKAFRKDMAIYIGEEKQKEEILSYRKHKTFDMITLKSYNNINQVLNLVNKKVYAIKSEINLSEEEVLDEELVGLNIVIDNNKCGIVTDVYDAGKNNKIIECSLNNKKVLIPYKKEFVSKIDIKNKTIEFNIIEGMI